MTPAQIDALVDQIGETVAKEVKTETEFTRTLKKIIARLQEEVS